MSNQYNLRVTDPGVPVPSGSNASSLVAAQAATAAPHSFKTTALDSTVAAVPSARDRFLHDGAAMQNLPDPARASQSIDERGNLIVPKLPAGTRQYDPTKTPAENVAASLAAGPAAALPGGTRVASLPGAPAGNVLLVDNQAQEQRLADREVADTKDLATTAQSLDALLNEGGSAPTPVSSGPTPAPAPAPAADVTQPVPVLRAGPTPAPITAPAAVKVVS